MNPIYIKLLLDNFLILLQFHFLTFFRTSKAFCIEGYSVILCLKIFCHSANPLFLHSIILLNNSRYRSQLTSCTDLAQITNSEKILKKKKKKKRKRKDSKSYCDVQVTSIEIIL